LAACEEIGVTLIGGHTEVTGSVDRIVVAGTMLGDAREESLISSAGARVGDGIILAGPIAIEGTTILAREARDDLLARGVGEDVIEKAESFLDKYGICVLKYARAALSAGAVTAMHDPTEGGLATAIRELTSASNTGALINRDAIPVLGECREICDALALDPLGLIASGCLLVTVPPNMIEKTVLAIERVGTRASIIGLVHDRECGVTFDDGSDMPVFERDEIARYFSSVNTAME
jgi:hydrogenase maturation factor